MNIIMIQKPALHCLIPHCHGACCYVPADQTDIRRTWERAVPKWWEQKPQTHDAMERPSHA